MPRNNEWPPIALLTPVDWRPFSGALFHMGDAEDPLTIADEWAGSGGLFNRGIIAALVGHGSATGVPADVDAAWDAMGGDAGELLMTLTDDDRWRISNTSASVGYLLENPHHSRWGLPTAETPIPAGGSITGSVDWVRGMVSSGLAAAPPYLLLGHQNGNTAKVPAVRRWATDLVVDARERGEMSDLDDGAAETCLEALTSATWPDAGIRWGVTDEGRVFWTQPVSVVGGGNPITWLSTAFRDDLGASGQEAVGQTGVGGDDVYYQIFDYPPRSLLVSSYGLAEPDERSYASSGRATQLNRGGQLTVRPWRDDQRHRLVFRVDGPADGFDWHNHLRERVAPRMARYPVFWLAYDWGDSRRAAERGGYLLLQTVEHEGYRGCIPLQLLGEVDVSVSWEDGIMAGGVVRIDARRAPAAS